MSSNIIDLDAHRPHIQGPAKCLHCNHEWQTVALAGVINVMCPSCGLMKGIFNGIIAPPEDREVWVCGCGNDLFRITRDASICIQCGKEQIFD